MKTQQRLAEVFVELADTLVDDFDVVDLLQTLADRTVELLGADASGLMLADQRGELQLMASTLERARLVEMFELQVAEGPCRECFTTGLPITNVDLTDALERWPRFTPVAVEAGFRATHALPMRLRGQIIGVLNLFTEDAVPLSEEDIAVGQAMADVPRSGCSTSAACSSRCGSRSSSRPRCRAGSSSSRPRASCRHGRTSASTRRSAGCARTHGATA
jgi:transcriptional regulator with GAF, ATPase, and Fis domain